MFDTASDAFQEVVELATNWNAAVELFRLAPKDAERADPPNPSSAPESNASNQYNGGIEDDIDQVMADDGGVKSTLTELASAGRSGGGKVVFGEGRELLDALDRSVSYSLVVIGDLFLAKGHAARLRMTRDLQRFVSDRISAPVVGTDELKAQYLFGRRDVARLAVFLVVVAALYVVVFCNQAITVEFLFGQWGDGSHLSKTVVAAAVFVFVPVIAHCYGTVAKSLMKLIKME
jgi:hypothetical protein